MFRGHRLLLAAAVALVPFASIAVAQDLEPKTYKSRSGEFALSIDPEERTGAGKARYTMQRGAATVWSAELPFALWDAVVADDGVVGGYAYTDGFERDDGEFVVAILDAGGKIRASERTPREWSHYLHTHGDPKANGLFLDAEGSRLVVRVADANLNTNSEAWWTYRLADGSLLGKPKPKELAGEQDLESMVDARPISGTPLTLVQWLRYRCCAAESGDFGAVFALLDADAKPVWKLVLPKDYVGAEDDPKDRIMGYIRNKGAILDAKTQRRFDLWHVADGAHVSYAVDGESGAWRVRESGRKPQAQVPVESTTAPMPAARRVDLPHLGTITLETRAEVGAIHDIYDFGIADRHRFAFVTDCACSGKSDDAALAIVDRKGSLLAKIPLPAANESRESLRYTQTWLGGDRWVVIRSQQGTEGRSTAFFVDAAAHSVTRADAFDAPAIEAVAATHDGGFVALTNAWHKYTMDEGIAAFDAEGRLRWTVGTGDYDDESKLFSAADVVVTPNNDIVVLENIRAKLKIYDRSGAFQRSTNLEDALKRAPAYLRGISVGAAGGVIVEDSSPDAPFVGMKLDGTSVRVLVPSFADGRRFDARGGIQAAADGTLWTSDGGALLRVDTRGVVQEVVGSRPEADVLGKVAALVVSGSGKIYAADERTAAVHVFDGEGKRLLVCRPDTKDYEAELNLPSLTVADTGDVFITRRDEFDHAERALDFIHYSPSCARVGVEAVALDSVAQRWHAQPGSTKRWIVGYDHIYLIGAEGQTERAIERDANGRWLLQPADAATAADGSIAVVSNEPAGLITQPVAVTVYSRGGDAIRTWPYPGRPYLASMAYDGTTIALLSGEYDSVQPPEATLLDTRTGATRLFAPASATSDSKIFIVARKSVDELWVSDGGTKIERYALQ